MRRCLSCLPNSSARRPEAFLQHPNAEISYLIEDSKALLEGLLSITPHTSDASSSTGTTRSTSSGGGGGSSGNGSNSGASSISAASTTQAGGGGGGAPLRRREDLVEAVASDLLDQVPGPFNLEALTKAKQDDPSALHVVLFQEVCVCRTEKQSCYYMNLV